MSGLIDFHTHILPCVDDGSSGVSESVAMLEAIKDQGISQVVLTPHFYPWHHSPDSFLARREEAYDSLLRRIGGRTDLPRMRLGAEVYYFEGISDSDCLDKMRISGTNAVLIEMPMGKWTPRMLRELAGIWEKQQIRPVVAHVDRYMGLLHNKDLPDVLADLPVMVQMNSSFFLHPFTAGRAVKLLEQQKVHLLGSDCHNMTSRVPNLEQAVRVIRKKGQKDLISRIVFNQQELTEKSR